MQSATAEVVAPPKRDDAPSAEEATELKFPKRKGLKFADEPRLLRGGEEFLDIGEALRESQRLEKILLRARRHVQRPSLMIRPSSGRSRMGPRSNAG